MLKKFLLSVSLAFAWLFAPPAHAGKYDLDLTNLGSTQGGNTFVTQQNGSFRSLTSELGVVMAPKPTDTADSLGLAGFAMSTDISLNTITSGASFWNDSTRGNVDAVVPTLQLLGRKGLWPGIEIGAGATKLFDSRMWTASGYGKVAIHEGFHHLPIPAIAVRGMFSRVLGAKDLFLTTMSLGATISHVFGIGSTFSLSPYGGFHTLVIVSHSNVLDATPGSDDYQDKLDGSSGDGRDSEFVFRRQDPILRHRPYLGARVIFNVIRVGAEAMFALAGSTNSDVDLNSGGTENVRDQSGLQQQYSLTVGLDF
ncbi:MAG: hypothetical protein V3V08_03500 [Nannocystaceae bacterium]